MTGPDPLAGLLELVIADDGPTKLTPAAMCARIEALAEHDLSTASRLIMHVLCGTLAAIRDGKHTATAPSLAATALTICGYDRATS